MLQQRRLVCILFPSGICFVKWRFFFRITNWFRGLSWQFVTPILFYFNTQPSFHLPCQAAQQNTARRLLRNYNNAVKDGKRSGAFLMWNNPVIQREPSWYVGYCRVLFLISSAHFTAHLTEEEFACEPGLIFHYCCTRDLCLWVCVCICESVCVRHICVCMRAFRCACAEA